MNVQQQGIPFNGAKYKKYFQNKILFAINYKNFFFISYTFKMGKFDVNTVRQLRIILPLHVTQYTRSTSLWYVRLCWLVQLTFGS